MLAATILIVMIPYYGLVTFQEFNSPAKCEAAAALVVKASSMTRAVCVPK